MTSAGEYLFASDGSGSLDFTSAGYGIAIRELATGKTYKYKGKVDRFEIVDAKIVNGNVPTLYYNGTKYAKPTNNRGELCGLLFAILLAKDMSLREMTVIMDSTYCINTFKANGWLASWIADGGIADGTRKNADIIKLIMSAMRGINVKFIHQKAHLTRTQINKLTPQGKLYNEVNVIADVLAAEGHTV